MSFRAGLGEQVGRLVHQTALESPDVAAQHRLFLETRLALGLGGLALVPAYLATGGIPGWSKALVVGWLTLPLVAAALLSARGSLNQAMLLSQGAWAGLAATLAFGQMASAVTACLLLVMIPVESGSGDDPRASRRVAVATLLLAAIILAVEGPFTRALHTGDLVAAAAAVAYAACLLVRGAAVRAARAEAARAELTDRTMLFDAVGDLALRFDGLLATVLNPRTASAQLGLPAAELAGRGFFERVHVQDRPFFLKLVSDAAHGAAPASHRMRVRVAAQPGAAQGFEEPVFASVEIGLRPWPGAAHDTPAAALVLLRSVSPAVIDEAPPVPTTGEADVQAWRDRFLATVSHELRTPLNAVIGFSEVLASDLGGRPDLDKQRDYAGIIHGSGQHLLEIVNSMLDLSKIDAGKLDLVLEPFDLDALLAACCDMMRLKAEKGRIDLEHLGPRRPVPMVGDARACRQIILNLLSNALKFTPDYGRVVATATAEGPLVALSVTDTGIGILPPDLANLGDPFFQAQNAYDRRFEGTGLGLCVVRGLVGLHGGTITAESAPGEGTGITVRLPVEGRAARPGSRAAIETIARPPRRAASDLQPPKVCRIA